MVGESFTPFLLRVERQSRVAPGRRCCTQETKGIGHRIDFTQFVDEQAELNFDRAIVLLNLFDDARVYSDQAFTASDTKVRSLSLRAVRSITNAPILESVVSDLVHERVVIMSAKHCQAIDQTRALRTPMCRVRVDLSPAGIVQVFVEA